MSEATAPAPGTPAGKGGKPDVLKASPYPELVFGLIGPAGTDLKQVSDALTLSLRDVGYNLPANVIRLSELIDQFLDDHIPAAPEDERIEALMTAGTKIRDLASRGDAVALLAVAEIRRIREEEFGGAEQRQAYILHSLKHPREIDTLRNIYGRAFFAISVYSPRDDRVTALSKRIERSRAAEAQSYARSKAEQLVERDESEKDKALGQNVKDAFPMADLFVDGRATETMHRNINRFVELLFGNWRNTPTPDEYAMYHAKSAALRSADLGRQVGAAIAESRDIVAVGCNEVPRYGGGLYWPGDDPDGRDFQVGADSSYEHREQILAEVLGRLCDHNLMEQQHRDKARELVSGKNAHVLAGTQLFSLLEFGRAVHAEMAALSHAARRGVAVKGGTLYSTTFPCHICAKHIVAAGITRVVYIEPYPKSKAKELFRDSIIVDPTGPTEGRVRFEAFVGVAPRQYLELFQTDGAVRKDGTGAAKGWSKKDARPRVTRFMNTYRMFELEVIGSVIADMRTKVQANRPLFSENGGAA